MMTAAIVILATVVGVKLWALFSVGAMQGAAARLANADIVRDALDRRSPMYASPAAAPTGAR